MAIRVGMPGMAKMMPQMSEMPEEMPEMPEEVIPESPESEDAPDGDPERIGLVAELLQGAIDLHQGHMDGTEEVTEESQETLMAYIRGALEALVGEPEETPEASQETDDETSREER